MSDCHSRNPLVFDTGVVKVYAGGTNRDGGWHRMIPTPDLAIGPLGVIVSNKTADILPKGWKSSDSLVGGISTIVMEIDWPDYGIPKNLGPSWWDALTEDIESKSISIISTQCMGGHGRTGIQLAILAHKLIPEKDHSWKDAGELITFIRDSYCKHAVESKQQQTYVADCCGIPIGETVCSVEQNAWSGIEFDDSSIMTEDEMDAQIRENERGRRRKPNKKAKAKRERYDDPIKRNWTLTKCDECLEYEWRRTSQEDMTIPCRTCASMQITQADIELLDGYGLIQCIHTDQMWHPIEMYNEDVSFKAEAQDRRMQVRDVEDADGGYLGTEIKINTVWQPTWWITLDDDDNLVPVSKIYTQMRKAERESGKHGLGKPTLDDYANKMPKKHKHDTILDAYREKRGREEVEDDFDELMGDDLLDRETNEEIEAED